MYSSIVLRRWLGVMPSNRPRPSRAALETSAEVRFIVSSDSEREGCADSESHAGAVESTRTNPATSSGKLAAKVSA